MKESVKQRTGTVVSFTVTIATRVEGFKKNRNPYVTMKGKWKDANCNRVKTIKTKL